MTHPTTPPAEPATRTIKARYLAAGMTVVYDNGTRDLVTGIIRDGDDVTATMADGATGTYHAEEGVTVTQTVRERLAAELHRIADDIVRLELPVGPEYVSSTFNVGIVDSRADLERWATHLGSEVTVDKNSRIPSTVHTIRLTDDEYGPTLRIRAQSDQEPESDEVERLRARVAELEAQQGGAQ